MLKRFIFAFTLLLVCKHSFAQWITTNLSSNRVHFSAVEFENRLYFIAGNTGSAGFTDVVDVYDLATNDFVAPTAISAPKRQSACAAGDSAIYVLGGHQAAQPIVVGTNIVDIFKNGAWHTDTIPDTLYHGTGLKVGNQILFTGFIKSNNTTTGVIDASDLVYIYNELTGQWSTANLSAPRMGLSTATNGTIAIFAGGENGAGIPSDVVDIYNATSNTWTTATLSDPKAFTSTAYCNGKFYVCGGALSGTGNSTDVIDVYDGNNWSTLTLPNPRAGIKAVTNGNYVYLIGGGDFNLVQFTYNNSTYFVDELNTTTGAWSSLDMNYDRINHTALAANNKLFVAGGYSTLSTTETSVVEIYDLTLGLEQKNSNNGISLFPNPAADLVSLKVEAKYVGTNFKVIDLLGKIVVSQKIEEQNSNIDLSSLSSGMYLVQMENLEIQKMVVKK